MENNKELLVIKINIFQKRRNYEEVYKSFLEQKKLGLIVLPPYCEVLVVPNNVEIKIMDPNNKEVTE